MPQWSKLKTGELKDVHAYVSKEMHERFSLLAKRKSGSVTEELKALMLEALKRDEQAMAGARS
jgi:hypothetical protein